MLEYYKSCPLCGSDSRLLVSADCSRHPLWHEPLPSTLEWMRCEHCGHVYTRHYWTEAGLAEVFRNVHDSQIIKASDNFDARRSTWTPVVERAIDLLGGYRPVMNAADPPTWVDVGCGNGALMMAAGDFGFSAIGVDARTKTADQLKNLGFNAIAGSFADIVINGRADVLSMMDLLEHLPYPKEALAKAADVVRPGGLIVISLPDLTCSTWRLMDRLRTNPYWGELEHHHNFGRMKLLQLLRDSGFEPAAVTMPNRYKAQLEVYAVRAPAR